MWTDERDTRLVHLSLRSSDSGTCAVTLGHKGVPAPRLEKPVRGNHLMPDPRFRTARSDDAPAVAGLHADSWQRHYRGAYTDTFLDEEAPAYLARLWTKRLAGPSPLTSTVLAEYDGELVGLACTLFGNDPTWGALVDNLHVRHL